MLTGMIPVYDLRTVGEQVISDIPNPICAIGCDRRIGGQRNLMLDSQLPQGGRERFRRT
jgi:hypothetical protein